MEAYWYWFCHELYLDRVWARELLGYYKNPEAVYRTKEAELLKLFPRKAARHLDFIKKRKNWVISEEWEKCQDKGIGFYSCEMEAFPQTLRDIPDAPLGIFVKGELPDPGLPAIAIVGARMCSAYGQVTASLFGRELAEHGVQIISGMAAGVDGYAHRGALKAGGKTFGILGCGVDVCYPRQNRDIYEAMAISGGLLSEYPPGTPPLWRRKLIGGTTIPRSGRRWANATRSTRSNMPLTARLSRRRRCYVWQSGSSGFNRISDVKLRT